MTAVFIPNPWGEFLVGRSVRLNLQVQVEADDGGLVGKDIQTSEIRLRAWDERNPTSFVFDETMTKSATGAAQGYVDHVLYLGSDTTPVLVWEVVEIEQGAPNPVALMLWRERVKSAPSGA